MLFRDALGEMIAPELMCHVAIPFQFGNNSYFTASMRDKKQTSVSHSSTESEVISFDADLRVGGLLVLHSRDVVIEV